MRYLLSPEILILIGVYATAVTVATIRAIRSAYRRLTRRRDDS